MFTPKRIKPSLSPDWEVKNKGKQCQFHFPGTAEPTVCIPGCPADETILPLAALPRHLQTRTSRAPPRLPPPHPPEEAPLGHGKHRCSPERRQGCGPRCPVPWSTPGPASGTSPAAPPPPPPSPPRRLGWTRLGSAPLGWTRALQRAPHAREWEDALPGPGRRERDDITAPCARRGGGALGRRRHHLDATSKMAAGGGAGLLVCGEGRIT